MLYTLYHNHSQGLLFKTLKVTLRLVRTDSGSVTQDQSQNISD